VVHGGLPWGRESIVVRQAKPGTLPRGQRALALAASRGGSTRSPAATLAASFGFVAHQDAEDLGKSRSLKGTPC
jgi:hypothetical protein